MLGHFFVRLPSGRTQNFPSTIDIKNLIYFDACGRQNILVLPDGKITKKLPSVRIFTLGQIYFNESGTALPNIRL